MSYKIKTKVGFQKLIHFHKGLQNGNDSVHVELTSFELIFYE